MKEKKFFDNFDRVICINLPHRTDRKVSFLEQCEKYDLGKFEFFNAINGNDIKNNYSISNGCLGLILSNIEIIKKAKNDGLNNLLIMEDDCVFNKQIEVIDDYLKMLPNNWDMLYLGGNHNIGWLGTSEPKKINDKIMKLHFTFTTHFVLINSRIFDVLIERLSKFNEPLDVIYTSIQKDYNVYCTTEMIASQKEGYSDIENKFVNYSNLIK